jgi:hypothetical protein
MGVQCGAAVAWENMSADVALRLRSRPSAGTTERRVARSSALTSHVRPMKAGPRTPRGTPWF